MKNVLIRILETALANLKSMTDDGQPHLHEAITAVGEALHLLHSSAADLSAPNSTKHRFVATDRFNNVRYLTVQGSTIRLWNPNGQGESLSSIAHNDTQLLIFALEDATSESEMLAALNRLTYQTWDVYVPDR